MKTKLKLNLPVKNIDADIELEIKNLSEKEIHDACLIYIIKRRRQALSHARRTEYARDYYKEYRRTHKEAFNRYVRENKADRRVKPQIDKSDPRGSDLVELDEKVNRNQATYNPITHTYKWDSNTMILEEHDWHLPRNKMAKPSIHNPSNNHPQGT